MRATWSKAEPASTEQGSREGALELASNTRIRGLSARTGLVADLVTWLAPHS
jgi:hypothetical protein